MNVVTIGFFIWALSKRRKIMNNMKEVLKKAGYNVSTKDQEEENVVETPVYRKIDFASLTKKEQKRMVHDETWRLENKIPYMWEEFAMCIAQYNFLNPENPITDDFLMRVVKQGEKMDIWGDDTYYCYNLRTHNSDTNYRSLVALMGEELVKEMESFGVSWRYYASLYDEIARKKW